MVFRALLVAALGIAAARVTQAQVRSGSADIVVDAPSSTDSAHVEARYVLTSQGPLELHVLDRPCATVGNIRVERNGVALGVAKTRSGPWMTYRASTFSGDTSRIVVRYAVKRGGSSDIPLLHPGGALAKVDVTVRGDDATRVDFPQMTRQASGWSGRYVAVPSFVSVANAGPCDPVDEPGDNGGLVWRFFLLVGIMVAWVPLYLAWARRSAESA